jgi:hypothetical protein
MGMWISRLFVFALLVVDWYCDPYFGRSTLSRPMESSAVSLSLAVCQDGPHFKQRQTLEPMPVFTSASEVLPARLVALPGHPEAHPAHPPDDLVYRLMSLRR